MRTALFNMNTLLSPLYNIDLLIRQAGVLSDTRYGSSNEVSGWPRAREPFGLPRPAARNRGLCGLQCSYRGPCRHERRQPLSIDRRAATDVDRDTENSTRIEYGGTETCGRRERLPQPAKSLTQRLNT